MPTNDPFELKIQGAATIPHPAERALINVHVTSEGTNKASIADEVITTSKHIEDLLREIAPKDDSAEASAASPLAHWNKTSLISRSWMPKDEHKGEVPPMKYSATVKYDIRFKEFKALGSRGITENNYYSHGERSFRKEHIATQHQRAMGETHGKFEKPDELEFRPQEVKMKKTVTIKFHADAVEGGI
ncbi:hypothetical protein PRZ48_004887 [Zasmidium cellare]|uniref:Uncharacterized protein n=1 Tax=Zasmidium cellare TaxID=395010 RepID=A0ABR0EQS5_ZASCE|nr:hypothetical protein PRZ48_004887 [Zasmidium cellare]